MAPDSFSLTLWCAQQYQNFESLQVDALLNGDTTPLYLAAQRGHVRAVRALLKAGANKDFEMPTGKACWQ